MLKRFPIEGQFSQAHRIFMISACHTLEMGLDRIAAIGANKTQSSMVW